jgi:hypothetical protein
MRLKYSRKTNLESQQIFHKVPSPRYTKGNTDREANYMRNVGYVTFHTVSCRGSLVCRLITFNEYSCHRAQEWESINKYTDVQANMDVLVN